MYALVDYILLIWHRLSHITLSVPSDEYLHCLLDDGEVSFGDDFDKIDSLVSLSSNQVCLWHLDAFQPKISDIKVCVLGV